MLAGRRRPGRYEDSNSNTRAESTRGRRQPRGQRRGPTDSITPTNTYLLLIHGLTPWPIKTRHSLSASSASQSSSHQTHPSLSAVDDRRAGLPEPCLLCRVCLRQDAKIILISPPRRVRSVSESVAWPGGNGVGKREQETKARMDDDGVATAVVVRPRGCVCMGVCFRFSHKGQQEKGGRRHATIASDRGRCGMCVLLCDSKNIMAWSHTRWQSQHTCCSLMPKHTKHTSFNSQHKDPGRAECLDN